MKNEAKKVRVCKPTSVKSFDGNDKVLTYRCYPCPTCTKWLIDNENHKYCQWCGQKLDWLIDKQRKEDEKNG